MDEYPDYDRGSTVEPPYQKTSTLALVSLIAGILGWSVIPLLGSIAAVITGHMAKREIRDSNGLLEGDGLATAGLVLGYVALGLAFIAGCIVAAAAVMIIAIAVSETSALPAWLALMV